MSSASGGVRPQITHRCFAPGPRWGLPSLWSPKTSLNYTTVCHSKFELPIRLFFPELQAWAPYR